MEKLAEACRTGDLQTISSVGVEELLRLSAKRDEDGRTLLHNAAVSGSLPLVQFLVDHGSASQVNASDEEGWTPLMSAVSCGHEGVVSLLLGLGGDPNAATASARRPLHYSASKGLPAIVRLLLQAGAEAEAKDVTGATPLHRAAATGRLDVVRLLMEEARCRVDPRNGEGATPLLLACMGGYQAVGAYLAAKGADVEAADAEGETPLGAAAAHGKMRDALVAVATGELDVDDILGGLRDARRTESDFKDHAAHRPA